MGSELKEFYKGQTIFLTGGSGGLGVLLLDILIRICDVEKIFLFLRPKKGKLPHERIDEIFKDAYFDTLKMEKPKFKNKVVVINGDLEENNLGISENDRKMLREKVTIVIHSAANVRFDQPLKKAALNNVMAVKQMLDLAKTIRQLKAYVHVSTSFCNATLSFIEEKFYKPPMSAENLLNLIDSMNDETLDRITPKLIEGYFNTYLYTKCIGEDLVKREAGDLPLILIRPAIIVPTYDGPCPGWINNYYGAIGLSLGVFIGLIRSLWLNKRGYAHIVPCDYVANCLLATIYNMHNQRQRNRFSESTNDLQLNSGQDIADIPIYNYVTNYGNHITWGTFISIGDKFYWKYPCNVAVWYYFCILTSSELKHRILSFLLQTIPGHIADFVLKCVGKPPMFSRIYRKLDNSRVTSRITNKDWNFDNKNVNKLWKQLNEEDKKHFKFDMASLNWHKYLEIALVGCRVHLLKDPLDTIPRARVKTVVLGFLHYLLITVFVYGAFRLICLFITN